MVLIRFPKSLQVMKPSLSLSNSTKASRNSREHTDTKLRWHVTKILKRCRILHSSLTSMSEHIKMALTFNLIVCKSSCLQNNNGMDANMKLFFLYTVVYYKMYNFCYIHNYLYASFCKAMTPYKLHNLHT